VATVGGQRLRAIAPGTPVAAPRSRAPGGGAVADRILDLQRRAGNRAVTAMVAVQRHGSWEHTLMGNTEPKELADAVVSPKSKRHLLEEQWRQVTFFAKDATRDPRPAFPDVRWIKLRGSALWVSYGELNALSDYLPNPAAFDTLPRSVVLPVLQRMRGGISGQVKRIKFAGEATTSVVYEKAGVGSDKAIDAATASLGGDRYLSVVARNACHFAPHSWHRWARFHEGAREHAHAYQRNATQPRPLKDLDTDADENHRQAILQNGYGDHFLQDSFAAGHLVNKTLVMQWFVDYVNDMASKWWDLLGPIVWWGVDNTRPWYGVPSGDVMGHMGTKQQPGMAGRHLYKPPTGGRTAHDDWARGTDVTDPQTAQERRTRDQRIAGSGVRATKKRTKEQNYEAYLKFLNSTFLGLAAGETHDFFNARGLMVANERGDRMQVGGDSTLLTKSGELGARIVGEAAALSRKAIDDILASGRTQVTVDQIWRLFPTKVWANVKGAETALPLEQWQDDVLHDICKKHIFPDVVDSFSSKTVRLLSPALSESPVGRRGGTTTPAPPPPPNMGDFVVPDRRAGVPV
jgi:hypothetical protein